MLNSSNRQISDLINNYANDKDIILSKADFDREIDTAYVNQIVSPDLITYTFHVIEHNEILGFRNVIVRKSPTETNIFLVHYPEGLDKENAKAKAIVQRLSSDILYSKTTECFELEFKCQLCGSSSCNIQPGWVLVKVSCDEEGGSTGGDTGGGDTPTNPIGGVNPDGSGPIGGGPNPVRSPCYKMSNKLKNDGCTNVDGKCFKERIKELKDKVKDTSREWGYADYYPDKNRTVHNYNTAQASASGKITFRVNGPQVQGFMHTHPSTGNDLSIPSAADIKAFFDLLYFRSQNEWDLAATYLIVIGRDGVYSLNLENEQDYLNTKNQFNPDSFWEKFSRNYNEKLKVYFPTLEDISKKKAETFIQEILSKELGNAGLSMYRLKDDMSGWEKLGMQNGEPKLQTCN